jgi:hypothetical protein
MNNFFKNKNSKNRKLTRIINQMKKNNKTINKAKKLLLDKIQKLKINTVL